MRRLDRDIAADTRPIGVVPRLVAAVVLSSAMAGCTGWPGPYGSARHLKDNPFDRAVATFDDAKMAAVGRGGLLKLFPIGGPTTELRRYLQSIGASCESGSGSPGVCQYSQYYVWGHRGIIGDEKRVYAYNDFTIRYWPRRGPIAKLTVCSTHSNEVQRGPMLLSSSPKPRESEFKPCI